ncbi:hypothetical protein CLOM_g16552, partial [Closterium sp. NIES-68]
LDPWIAAAAVTATANNTPPPPHKVKKSYQAIATARFPPGSSGSSRSSCGRRRRREKEEEEEEEEERCCFTSCTDRIAVLCRPRLAVVEASPQRGLPPPAEATAEAAAAVAAAGIAGAMAWTFRHVMLSHMDAATSSWDAHRDVEAVFIADGRSVLQFRPRPPAPAAMMITDDSGLSEEAACGDGGGGGRAGGNGGDGSIVDPILQVDSSCQIHRVGSHAFILMLPPTATQAQPQSAPPSARAPPLPPPASAPRASLASAFSIRFLLSSQADTFARTLATWKTRSAPASSAAAAAAAGVGSTGGGGGGGNRSAAGAAGGGSADCEEGGIQNGVAAGVGRDQEEGCAAEATGAGGEGSGGGRRGEEAANAFDRKIEASSAKMYFHYYGQLLHQQNMLQDYVRTGTYYAAVLENRADFEGKIVVDVGAGSGILSLFAARAGAKHVYAIEASNMAHYASKLAAGNPLLGQNITIIHGKAEDVSLPFQADVLISEPMGTLLVNERMLETYVIARNRFLKPGGKMFPSAGRIHVAPFSDEYLYVEMANKALFWQQRSYYGVDLTPLHGDALNGYFAQPVVDAFDPRILIAPSTSHPIDFNAIQEGDLFEIDIPLSFKSNMAARLHGLACWFDVLFSGSSVQRWLSTAPGAPTTHWYQLRCVLAQPLYVFAGQLITGRLRLVAHSAQSYTIHLTLSTHAWSPDGTVGGVLQSSTGKLDLKEPYYRMSQASLAWTQEQPQVQAQTQTQQQVLQQMAMQQILAQQQQQQHQGSGDLVMAPDAGGAGQSGQTSSQVMT